MIVSVRVLTTCPHGNPEDVEATDEHGRTSVSLAGHCPDDCEKD